MCEPDAAAGAFTDGFDGASSVLYGTVPDQAPKGDISRGFALFYSDVTGAGGLAPIAYGVIADHSNRTVGILAAALTAAVIIPLVLALRPQVEAERSVLAHQESRACGSHGIRRGSTRFMPATSSGPADPAAYHRRC